MNKQAFRTFLATRSTDAGIAVWIGVHEGLLEGHADLQIVWEEAMRQRQTHLPISGKILLNLAAK
jgi:hypothetical protein